MKKTTAMFVMIGVTVAVMSAITAQADTLPLYELKLTLDQAGNVTLTNVTGAPLDVNYIHIESFGGNLDPLGWYSIADAVAADPGAVLAGLGPGTLSFNEVIAMPGFLAEYTVGGHAVFQPGAPWAYGQPVLGTPSIDDLDFHYRKPTTGGADSCLGVIEILSEEDEPIPEPGNLALVGLALLAVRRKRA